MLPAEPRSTRLSMAPRHPGSGPQWAAAMATRSVGAATIANIADVESHDDPAPTVTKMVTATTSDDSPDTDVTVARAGPVMLSCSLASLTTATFLLSP